MYMYTQSIVKICNKEYKYLTASKERKVNIRGKWIVIKEQSLDDDNILFMLNGKESIYIIHLSKEWSLKCLYLML